MKPVLTPAEMADADRRTIEAGTPSLDLMERAGAAVARAAIRLAGGAYGKRFLVVCGKGNNAGDGFVAARKLTHAGGFPVIVNVTDPGELSGDAKANYERLGPARKVAHTAPAFERELARADVVIDALFGTGLKGRIEGDAASMIQSINRSGKPVVAVDIPSGVNGETGTAEGPAVWADLTVTMAALKTGIAIPPGCIQAGEIEIADIGIDRSMLQSLVALTDSADVAALLAARPPDAHKRSVGTVLVVAGSVGMSGAAALTALGALRAGAGLVTVATASSVAVEIDQRILEGTVLPLPETGNGTIEPSAVAAVVERARNMDVVAIGPGLSTNQETVEFVHKLLAAIENPVVIDADGLNALGGSLDLIAGREPPTLITPHPGEMGRLLGISTKEVQAERLRLTNDTAKRTGAAVLLKGHRTIIASPDGQTRINPTGGPALATGGSGDVLTGVSAAILASTNDAFAAGWAGAWIHGRAGDLLSRTVGERGVIAGDVADWIPEAINQ